MNKENLVVTTTKFNELRKELDSNFNTKLNPVLATMSDTEYKLSVLKMTMDKILTLLDELVREPEITLAEEYEAEWKYWEGWCGNHDKRIEDATCSKCGYKHPTIRFGSPDLLQDYCPSCKSRMKKR